MLMYISPERAFHTNFNFHSDRKVSSAVCLASWFSFGKHLIVFRGGKRVETNLNGVAKCWALVDLNNYFCVGSNDFCTMEIL